MSTVVTKGHFEKRQVTVTLLGGPCACRIRVVLHKRAFFATGYYRPARTRATRDMRIPPTLEIETTIAILPMSEQHDLELLAYRERVDLAVQAMDRNPNITRRCAASTFKIKRRSLRDRSAHELAEATITSTKITPNNPENRNFHTLPVELICTILNNLKSTRDSVAVGQTSQTLCRVAIDHLCQNACRYYDAILWAIIARRRTLLRLLLQRGAAFAHEQYHSISAVASAAGQGDEVMVRLLLNTYGTISNLDAAISEAVLRGHVHIVKLTLDMYAGTGVDYTKLYLRALGGASYRGQKEIVKMLLDAGVPANETGPGINSALHSAAGGGYEQIVKLLLEAGANANAIGGHGDSALQSASFGGYDTVVRLLLEAGASTSRHRALFYGSALQKASEFGHERVVELLIRAGACVNTPGGRSGSALQRARRNRHMKVVELLRSAGARENMLV
jgi:ankyrin repeat protein